MWRRISAVAVLGAVAHAQMLAIAGGTDIGPDQQPAPAQSHSEHLPEQQPEFHPQLAVRGSTPLFAPHVSSYSRHNKLRRERDEEFVMLLCKPANQLNECPLQSYPWDQPVIPVTMKLTPKEGFQVRFREGKDFRVQQQANSVQTEVGTQVFRFKVRAGKEVSMGNHVLEGSITYQIRGREGLSKKQEVPINIPVTVVDHNAQVVEAHWSLESPRHHDIGAIILLTLTAPIWGPLLLVFLAAYEISGY